jgi:proline iminopeptidase
MFNPDRYRAVLFDQRGSGQSRPFASIENNTTDHLVADIEHIRTQLEIDSWVVFGGSWGATMSLVYGIRHPEHCLGFVLRGVFLGTKPEIDWFLYDMRRFYPEAWERFSHFLPEDERDDILAAYWRRLSDPDQAESHDGGRTMVSL